MKTVELWSLIEKICPGELAEEWDNSGPQISFDEQEVSKVLVALEITYDVIKEAIAAGANVILTHHPQFFTKNAWITPEYTIGTYTLELVKNKISVFSAHTSFDNLKGGNNDCLGEILGIKDIAMPTEEGLIYRTGRVEPVKIKDFITHICNALDIDKNFVHLVGDPEKMVTNVAWCTGAGFEFIYDAYKHGAECYITGDVKYHDARDASERCMNVIDIGHFGSEKIFSHNMAEKLKAASGLDILESHMDSDPFYTDEF